MKAKNLRAFREARVRLVRNVAVRCEAASQRIRSRCSKTIRSVNRSTNFVLLGVLAAAIDWPDDTLMRDFTEGFPVVGLIEASGAIVRVRGNRVGPAPGGWVQLRLGQDLLWYRLEQQRRQWVVTEPPSTDPGDLVS